MAEQLDPKMLENLEILLDLDAVEAETEWDMFEQLEPTDAAQEEGQ